jgi:hypothetical protein
LISKINRRSFLLTALAAAPAGKLLGVTAAPATPPVIEFEDVTAKSGIRFQHEASRTSEKYLPESMGAGVAMFDYDNDGWLDLFFVNGAKLQDPMPRGISPDKSDPRYWNRLYHNNRDGTFTDSTEKAGLQGRLYGMGVATGDYDNDGNVDLLVTNLGGNILYHNNGDGTFTDVTAKAGVGGSGWCTGACFVDYDRDGRLDLIVSRYVQWDFSEVFCGEHRPGHRAYCHPDQFEPITHLMFHNNGDGTFTDVSKKCRIAGSPGKGLGVAINDFDGDGWPDIFVANDSVAEQLFRNNHDGTFTEVALISGLGYDQNGHAFAGMGADFGDYKNAGWPSLFVNALANQKYKLFLNDKGTFDDVTDSIGLGASTVSHSGWGAKWIDYDNDGWLDLFVAQGHVMDNIQLTEPALRYLEPPLLLRNDQGRFSNVSPQSGGSIFATPIAARGAAFGDLDNDGLVDVAINCNDGPAIVLHNRENNGNHWLMLNLTGTSSNRDAIGSKIRLVTDTGQQQTRFVSTAGSYISASDKRAHFGLGPSKKIRLIEITWPCGTVQRLESVSADQILQVKEPSR